MKGLGDSKHLKRFLYSMLVLLIICVSFSVSKENTYAADSDVVTIPDANFKATLNKALGISNTSANLTKGQLAKITCLSINLGGDAPVKDITGISYCTNITQLVISGDENVKLGKAITDKLVLIQDLRDLDLRHVKCDDYSFMGNWSSLLDLDLSYCDIKKLPNLSKCTKLEEVSIIACSSLVDISALSQLKNIKVIDLKHCSALSDISPLTGMSKLTSLNLEQVPITDANKATYMKTISSLTNMEELYMYFCNISDEHTSMFNNFTKIKVLGLGNNDISNISFLTKYKNTLEKLSLWSCELDNDDLSVILQLTNLTLLDISKNRISDFSFINKLPKLTNSYMRSVNWTESSPATGSNEIIVPYFTKPAIYVFENKVKDANGNYVAPKTSQYYQYNKQTNQITIYADKVDRYAPVEYEFVNTKSNGDKFYVGYKEDVRFGEINVIEEDVVTNLEGAFVLGVWCYTADEAGMSYQWYKDGKKISGATSSIYEINKAQLSDGGKYKVVATIGGNSATSGEIVVTVRNYKQLSAKLEVESDIDIQKLCVGDYYTFKVTVQDGSGEYSYKYCMKYEDGSSSKKLDDNKYTTYLYITGNTKLYVEVYDADGSYATTNEITINVKDRLNASYTVNKVQNNAAGNLGENVSFDIKATGGVGQYRYGYVVYDANTKKIVLDMSAMTDKSTYLWKPDACGDYYVFMTVKDSAGHSDVSCPELNIGDIKTYRKLKISKNQRLYKATDGKWHYYVNDKIDTSYTGLAKNENGWWYVKDGQVDFTYTGLVKNDSGWWYVKKGQVDFSYTGLAKNEYGWWYVKNGKVDRTYTGMAKNEYGWWYVTDGKLDRTYTGPAQNEYGWWYMRNGEVSSKLTGIYQMENGWWYVKDGQVMYSYTGIVDNGSYGSFYIKNGRLDWSYTGLAKSGQTWWYIKGGKLDTTYTGLAKNDAGWWYVKDGKLDRTYTGLAKNDSGWWYVKEGKVDFTYTGMAKNEYGWWYVTNGKLDRTYTGMAKNENGWWYIKEGKLDKTYTGIAQNEYGWWYMRDGKVSSKLTGIVQTDTGWWYVKDGQIDYTFTGLVDNGYGLYYIQKGKLDWSFNGTITYEGKTYKIVNGKVSQ